MLALVFATSTSILVAGRPIEVGRPVVLWNDPEGFDGYAESCVEADAVAKSPCCARSFKRFEARRGLRTRTLEALRPIVTQVVLHLDGCVNSRSCFYSMHDLPRAKGGCGLSAHFMIDADGTIYQTLDPLERAWHAEQNNNMSIGVEICNRGDAGRNELDRLPPDYRTRPVKDVVINGHAIHAFDFRPEQYDSVIALTRALLRVFPQIRPVIPERSGEPLLEALPRPTQFRGIVGHLHVDLRRQKWDPGAFDWERLKRGIQGLHFPVAIRNWTALPDDAAALNGVSSGVFRDVEEHATGFFPIAPGRLWHSGVHLRGAAGDSVYAPARGRLLAARLAQHAGSSTSFVLLRHDLSTASGPMTFYSLLMHLGVEPLSAAARPAWIRELVAESDTAALTSLLRGEVALLDRPVESGDVVGVVGAVHRGAEQGSEIHFEIFSSQVWKEELGRSFRFLEGAADGPVLRRGAVVQAVESATGGSSADALLQFFRTGDLQRRQALRHLAIRHQHEWGDRLGELEYLAASELKALAAPERRNLYQTAIKPYVFWTAALSRHAGLPVSQIIYSYHPITFLVELAARLDGIALHWPARAALVDQDLPPSALPSAMLEDWLRPRSRADEGPIFGPVLNGGPLTRRKRDIQLLVLPPVR